MKIKSHFDFSVDRKKKLVKITDLNMYGMSVTNDMENVCDYIEQHEKINLSEYTIIYRDSTEVWDGVLYNKGQVNFISLNETDEDKAEEKIFKKNELRYIVGEDMICPITKEHCDDECCTVGSICNVSGPQNIFDKP